METHKTYYCLFSRRAVCAQRLCVNTPHTHTYIVTEASNNWGVFFFSFSFGGRRGAAAANELKSNHSRVYETEEDLLIPSDRYGSGGCEIDLMYDLMVASSSVADCS